MKIDRTKMVSGPCKITVGTDVLYSVGDVELSPETETRNIESSVNGVGDEVAENVVLKLKFKPKPIYAYAATLLPAAFIALPYSGAWLFPSTDQAVEVQGADGEKYTMHNARITKLPDMHLGLGEDLWGDVEFTGLHIQGADTDDESALITLGTGTWNQADFPTSHDEVDCLATWGAKTGFAAMESQTGWKLSHELNLKPVLMAKQVVNYKVVDYRCMVKGMPVGPTAAQLAAELYLQGTGGGAGRRLSVNAADLAITGTGISVTQKGAALKSAGFKFGSEVLRNGEFGWVNTLPAGGARLVLCALLTRTATPTGTLGGGNLTLAGESNAAIYYTTDGITPPLAELGATLYSAPFAVSTGQVILFAAYHAGKLGSNVVRYVVPA